MPKKAWTAAIDADDDVRKHAEIVEITGLLILDSWRAGMRVIVRREHPRPGAQLSLFEERDGWAHAPRIRFNPKAPRLSRHAT